MKDSSRTKQELIEELSILKKKIKKLQLSESDRKQTEKTLRESEAQKNAILNGIATNIAFVDKDLRILWVNKKAAESVNKSLDEMTGHTCHEFWADPSKPCKDCPTLRAFQTQKPEHTILHTPDGRIWDERGEPVFDTEGNLIGVVKIAQDITERKQAEEALRESEERYRTIIETIQDGYFEIDLTGKYTFVNDVICQHLKYSREELIGIDNRKYQNEANAKKAYQHFADVYITGTPDKAFEMEVISKDGTIQTSEVSISLIKNAQGQPIGFRGISRDITERKRVEEALQKSEERYRLLVENTNEAILVIQDGMIKFVNSQTVAAFGYSEQELMFINVFELIHPEDRDLVMERYLQKINGDMKPTRQTYRTIHKGGQTQWIEISSVLINWEGKPATLNLLTNITERKQMEKALRESEERYRELSIVDDLTQLYNSRHFYFQLKIELERSNRYKQPLTLLLFDIDNFKAFNDTYGHIEGDHVLRRLGQVVKRCLRETDLAYRYGGEEFTILLPMTTSADGAVTAERIRTEFKKENFSPAPGQEFYLTVSIGLSQYKPKEDIKAFVHRVDQLMYQAKKNGKDRVCSEA
jgi:diguanylate cyclase (GGDEF)-like protein/PAS domain S-box-containing protein